MKSGNQQIFDKTKILKEGFAVWTIGEMSSQQLNVNKANLLVRTGNYGVSHVENKTMTIPEQGSNIVTKAKTFIMSSKSLFHKHVV